MKITVKQSDLEAALKTVIQSAVIKARPKEFEKDKERKELITEMVKIEANGNIALTCTDLETTTKTIVPGQIDKPGETCVNAKRFLDIVNVTDGEDIYLDLDGSSLKIHSNIKNRLVVKPAEEFPTFPAVPKEHTNIPGYVLNDITARVMFAASTDKKSPREEFFGMFLHDNNAVAADGSRLAVLPCGLDLNVIVPIEAIKLAAKTFGKKDKVMVGKENGQIFFSDGITTLAAQLLSGRFPNYWDVIPNSFNRTVKVDRKDMLMTCKQANVITREGNGAVSLSIDENSLTVRAESPETGEFFSNFAASIEGDIPFKINIMNKFLLDGLNACKGNEIYLYMNTPDSAVMMTEPGVDWKYLMMPCD